VSCARFQRAHQAQLEPVSAVFFQYADTAEISRIVGVRRGYEAGKGHRYSLVIRQPPMPPIEFRNGRAVKKCQAVKICQRVRDFVVMPSTSRILNIGQAFKTTLACASVGS
jgi:hypothetical protein